MERYYILTFETVSNAMQAESVFKNSDFSSKTIPVPREISASCGLAIRFEENALEDVEKEFLMPEKIHPYELYLYEKDDEGNRKASKREWSRSE